MKFLKLKLVDSSSLFQKMYFHFAAVFLSESFCILSSFQEELNYQSFIMFNVASQMMKQRLGFSQYICSCHQKTLQKSADNTKWFFLKMGNSAENIKQFMKNIMIYRCKQNTLFSQLKCYFSSLSRVPSEFLWEPKLPFSSTIRDLILRIMLFCRSTENPDKFKITCKTLKKLIVI